MLAIVGQTAGPNGLTFFKETHEYGQHRALQLLTNIIRLLLLDFNAGLCDNISRCRDLLENIQLREGRLCCREYKVSSQY